MRKLNAILLERKIEGHFITLTYAIWEPKAKTLRLANAGMPLPVLIRKGHAQPIHVEGVPLGLLENTDYEETHLTLEKGDLLAKAKELGRMVQQRLQSWPKKSPLIGNVRGLGPMQAIEFVHSQETRQPHPEAASAMVRYAYEHGVICMTSGTYSNVLRLLMPLIISREELEEGFAVLEQSLTILR